MAPAVQDLADLVGDGGLLFVHAHPDDETITTGATMARFAERGNAVTLLTCTRGELGEVIGDVPGLSETGVLGADGVYRDVDGDALAAHREGELAAAMRALGVQDHRFLGGAARRYRDSGMVWGPDGLATVPPDVSPDAFGVAELDEVAGLVAAVIDEVRPAVVITYEPGGGYGHPDHVRASEVTSRAVQLAATPTRLLWVVTPESVARQGLSQMALAGLRSRDPDAAPPSMIVPDEAVRWASAGPAQAKASGLRAHATQVIVGEDAQAFALSNQLWQPLSGVEYFAEARN